MSRMEATIISMYDIPIDLWVGTIQPDQISLSHYDWLIIRPPMDKVVTSGAKRHCLVVQMIRNAFDLVSLECVRQDFVRLNSKPITRQRTASVLPDFCCGSLEVPQHPAKESLTNDICGGILNDFMMHKSFILYILLLLLVKQQYASLPRKGAAAYRGLSSGDVDWPLGVRTRDPHAQVPLPYPFGHRRHLFYWQTVKIKWNPEIVF